MNYNNLAGIVDAQHGRDVTVLNCVTLRCLHYMTSAIADSGNICGRCFNDGRLGFVRDDKVVILLEDSQNPSLWENGRLAILGATRRMEMIGLGHKIAMADAESRKSGSSIGAFQDVDDHLVGNSFLVRISQFLVDLFCKNL